MLQTQSRLIPRTPRLVLEANFFVNLLLELLTLFHLHHFHPRWPGTESDDGPSGEKGKPVLHTVGSHWRHVEHVIVVNCLQWKLSQFGARS